MIKKYINKSPLVIESASLEIFVLVMLLTSRDHIDCDIWRDIYGDIHIVCCPRMIIFKYYIKHKIKGDCLVTVILIVNKKLIFKCIIRSFIQLGNLK